MRATLLLVPLLLAAAPLPPLSPEQRKMERERDQLFVKADKALNAKDTPEAVRLIRQGLNLDRAIHGDLPNTALGVLELMARLLEQSERWAEAADARREVLATRSRLYAPDDWRVTECRLNLAECLAKPKRTPEQRRLLARAAASAAEAAALFKKGQGGDALAPAREALKLRREALGDKHPLVIGAILDLATITASATDAGPVALLEEAASLSAAVLGERHPTHVQALTRLGSAHIDGGAYGKADVALTKALALGRRLHGPGDTLGIGTVGDIGAHLVRIGQFSRALPLLREAEDKARRLIGAGSAAHIRALNNLGSALRDTGQLADAGARFRQAHALARKRFGERHPLTAACLHNVADLLATRGDHAAALPAMEQALALRRSIHGARSPQALESLNNLAALHSDLGDTARAAELFAEAALATRDIRGDGHPDLATALNNRAQALASIGRLKEALPLLERAVRIHEGALAGRHPDLGTTLANLAVFHIRAGRWDEAHGLAQRAYRLLVAARGRLHPATLSALGKLIMLYLRLGDRHRALALAEREAGDTRDALGGTHPETLRALGALGAVRLLAGQRGEAERLFRDALAGTTRYMEATFSVLGEGQRLALLRTQQTNLSRHLSVTRGRPASDAEAYEEILAWKGMAAARAAEDRLARTPALAKTVEELRVARAALAGLIHRPRAARDGAWARELRDAEALKARLDADLSRLVKVPVPGRAATGKELAALLPAGVALVDVVEYGHRTPPKEGGIFAQEWSLAAFVVLPGKPARRVDLGPVAPVEKAIRAWRLAVESGAGDPDARAGAELRRLLWTPLAPTLVGSSTVLIAPAGAACGLPWAALPGARPGTFLIEEVGIAVVPSARSLPAILAETRAGEGLLALGGASFGAGRWADLPGTRFEAARVASLYRDAHPRGPAPVLLAGGDSSKAGLLKALAAPRRYVHLATHGFFLAQPPPKPDDEGPDAVASRSLRRNPLLMAGLLLAGANTDPASGTLTAEEVAGIDLSGCELAVLSACETGLGTLAGGEGVLGLQRAFQAAGARTAVTSLWSVSDAATSVLMEDFYRRLWGKTKVSKLEALRQAQLFVLKNPNAVQARAEALRAEAGMAADLRGVSKTTAVLPSGGKPGGARSPVAWWAGFVLSGDWR